VSIILTPARALAPARIGRPAARARRDAERARPE
jgi:hypothetical protein